MRMWRCEEVILEETNWIMLGWCSVWRIEAYWRSFWVSITVNPESGIILCANSAPVAMSLTRCTLPELPSPRTLTNSYFSKNIEKE